MTLRKRLWTSFLEKKAFLVFISFLLLPVLFSYTKILRLGKSSRNNTKLEMPIDVIYLYRGRPPF